MASVLVVEDEALIADDLERTLTAAGYQVVAAVGRGEEALTAALALRPELALMDIKLGGELDGVDTARLLRERAATPSVFLTSFFDDATLERASHARPLGYVTKPFAERDLLVAVQLAMHQAALERQLASSERRFRTTLYSVADAVVVTDETLTVVFLNPAAEALTGWPASEAVGQPVGEVVVLGDALNRRSGLLASALTRREPVHQSAVRLHGRHRAVVVDQSVSPIIDDGGRPVGVVVVFRDVTERAELEARVARTERLAALAMMAGGATHEISNPLAVVVGNLEYALDHVDRRDVKDALGDAHASAQRMGAVIKDLRSFAIPGRRAREPVPLARVVDASVEAAGPLAREHARLEREVTGAPVALGDQAQLERVLGYLIANSVEAIGPGRADRHVIAVSAGPGRTDRVVLEVRDDGRGIPPEVLPRIFDPFFTTKPPGHGLGLGLCHCTRIVDAHGGAITVDSVPGRGTTVRVELPRAS